MDGSKPDDRSDEAHTAGGAPTDQAHKEVGDGTLVGAAPAGLSPQELEEMAEEDSPSEPGTS